MAKEEKSFRMIIEIHSSLAHVSVWRDKKAARRFADLRCPSFFSPLLSAYKVTCGDESPAESVAADVRH